MSDYLSTAAEALGVPEALVMRSAQARAATSGLSVEDILAAWAGGSAAPAGTASAPAPEAPAGDASDLPAESTTPDSTPMEPVAAAPEPEPATPAEPKIVPARPVPETVGLDKAGDWESVTTVATAGLKERTKTRVPSWLTAAFVVLPLVGLLYLLQFSGGPDCGSSGLLAVDRISGEVVNCDGSPFEGRGGPRQRHDRLPGPRPDPVRRCPGGLHRLPRSQRRRWRRPGFRRRCGPDHLPDLRRPRPMGAARVERMASSGRRRVRSAGHPLPGGHARLHRLAQRCRPALRSLVRASALRWRRPRRNPCRLRVGHP